ncbi:hypothetical protein HY968_03800 [Candidatus Kaiserbacteria bacterium]|nr:hypothetical protein [Candidatus Kaiserbacteria bacterium]
MTISARPFLAAILILAFLVPIISHAEVISDVRIGTDGKFVAKNLTVMQKSGNNLFCRATWGQSYVRVTLLMNAATVVTKNHGESALASEITYGDIIDAEGTLSTAADNLTVIPTSIRDTTLDTASKTISGTVTNVYPAASSFVLVSKESATTTVLVSSGTIITKGARQISLADIAAHDKILSVKGDYDYQGRALSANEIRVYQDQNIFAAKNFQGTLSSVSGTGLPSTLTVKVEGTNYTVYLSATSMVLNKAKSPASLSRFVAGDTVRFFGKIRASDLSAVDAEVLRDLNF